MESSNRRTAVLFGAGASVDAGLPQTQKLAQEVVERANSRQNISSGLPEAWVQSLNFIYGSMVEYGSRSGGNPLQAVDFERLVSAIRLLKEPDSHESAPFVMNWKPGSAGFSSTQPHVSSHSFERTFSRAVANVINGHHHRSSELFREIHSMIGAKPDLRNSFEKAEDNVFVIVKEILAELEDTEYLGPLAELASIQNEGLDVLTLNYDLAVETMASANRTKVIYGFHEWSPGAKLKWKHERGNLNLIKMHGSLNWHQKSWFSFLPAINAETGLEPISEKPWIVLGDKEKLSTKGPTLDLLRAAEDALERTDHLVVAGYSFSDDHVNNLIFAWLEGEKSRALTIIDPGFPRYKPRWGREKVSVRDYLMEKYPLRLKIIRKGTAGALKPALNNFSEGVPEKWFHSEIKVTGESKRQLDLTLLGPTLTNLSLSCMYTSSKGDGDAVGISLQESKSEEQINPSSNLNINEWVTGETKKINLISSNDKDIRLRIWAYTFNDGAHINEELVFHQLQVEIRNNVEDNGLNPFLNQDSGEPSIISLRSGKSDPVPSEAEE